VRCSRSTSLALAFVVIVAFCATTVRAAAAGGDGEHDDARRWTRPKLVAAKRSSRFSCSMAWCVKPGLGDVATPNNVDVVVVAVVVGPWWGGIADGLRCCCESSRLDELWVDREECDEDEWSDDMVRSVCRCAPRNNLGVVVVVVVVDVFEAWGLRIQRLATASSISWSAFAFAFAGGGGGGGTVRTVSGVIRGLVTMDPVGSCEPCNACCRSQRVRS
jgi:hypothetical protein